MRLLSSRRGSSNKLRAKSRGRNLRLGKGKGKNRVVKRGCIRCGYNCECR